MFVVRVPGAGVQPRLDAGFYDPQYLEDERALHVFARSTLDQIRLSGVPIRYGVIRPRETASSSRMIRIQDFDDPFVDLDRSASIDPRQMQEFARAECRAGDLLVAIGGYPGRIGIVPVFPQGVQLVNINQHIARIRVDSSTVDCAFLAAFLLCGVGRRLLARQVSGSVQAGINLEDLREIRVPVPMCDVQAYIGDKIRQAEVLRAHARGLGREATEFFEPIHARTFDGWRGAWRRNPAKLGEGRLDSWFYAPAPTDLVDRLSAAGVTLGRRVRPVRGSAFDRSSAISYFEIGGLDVATGCAWPSTVQPGTIPSRAQRSIRPWDLLVSTVRPERKNVALVGPQRAGQQLVASTGFSVLRASSPAEAAFVCWYLRSDAGTDQLLRWNTGATYPAIDDDVPLQVLMPNYAEDLIQRLGRRWMQIPEGLDAARQMTASARLLVEALIDRKVTEAELVAAHSDATADRALMQRLTQEGLDVDGAPRLFDDLDRLEELLEEARRDPTEDAP